MFYVISQVYSRVSMIQYNHACKFYESNFISIIIRSQLSNELDGNMRAWDRVLPPDDRSSTGIQRWIFQVNQTMTFLIKQNKYHLVKDALMVGYTYQIPTMILKWKSQQSLQGKKRLQSLPCVVNRHLLHLGHRQTNTLQRQEQRKAKEKAFAIFASDSTYRQEYYPSVKCA